jgi:hypothetical protein
MQRRKPRRIAMVGVTIGSIGLMVASFAIASYRPSRANDVGGSFLGEQTASATSAFESRSSSFQTLPGSELTVGIASGTSRLVEARFMAESSCFGGTAGNWCTVRVVARNSSTGALVELSPEAGGDFQFDTVSQVNDRREGHAIERSRRLGAGGWNVFVELKTTSTSTTVRLDDWHFAVEVMT